jgi:cell division protease FtsH
MNPERNTGNEEGGQRPPAHPQWGMRPNLLVWIVAILTILFVSRLLQAPTGGESLSYTAFKEQVREGKIAAVTFRGAEITGTFEAPAHKGQAPAQRGMGGKASPPEQFTTTKPDLQDPGLLPLLEMHGVTVRAESSQQSPLMALLIALLPWVLLIGLFVYMGRKFQASMGGGGGLFGLGKSKAKRYSKTASQVKFEDVAGLANSKRELVEIVDFLKDPMRFRNLGGRLPKGILLVGPPGTGKTLLARAVAGEAEVPFFSISASEFIEMVVGVGASRVRDLFANARKDAPSIIFIDELDSIGRARGTGLGGGHDEREQTLNQILSEMDGFDPHESVVVLAATNRPDVLDPALVRPGRFDRQVTLELPQRAARGEILRIHTREVPLAHDVDLEAMARRTAGLSGADLSNLVNEAALLAARLRKRHVMQGDFDQALDKIRMGTERDEFLGEEEKRLVAYHEAGHALAALLLPEADPLEKVSIIPRGRALGATEQLPEEERSNLSRRYLLDRLEVLLSGRAAELLVFGDVTSGAAQDLQQATQLARHMVCQWGMSEKIGPVVFRLGETHPFLGRELASPRDFSEDTARLIDQEVRIIVEEAQDRARKLLDAHRKGLDTIAQALVEHETLDREEVERLLGKRPQDGSNGDGAGRPAARAEGECAAGSRT